MQGTTLLIIVLLAIVVIVALVLAFARRGRMRRLSPESQQRYSASWEAIRTRFIEDPRGAVTEADQLVVAILSEQGLNVESGKGIPDDLTKARGAARLDQGSGATEDLRTSMLHYQRVVDHAVGGSTRKAAENDRREIAS